MLSFEAIGFKDYKNTKIKLFPNSMVAALITLELSKGRDHSDGAKLRGRHKS
jgi:hypothetical protein